MSSRFLRTLCRTNCLAIISVFLQNFQTLKSTMAELRSDEAVDKGNFNDRRRSALDSLMIVLQQRLSGGVEEFVTHLHLTRVIRENDWQSIERTYKTDETRIFHLLKDVLIWRDGSWEEILVFLYNSNCSDLAGKLQSAAGEPTVHPTTKVTVAKKVNTSLTAMETLNVCQPSTTVDWRQFIRDVTEFHLGDYRVVESFDVDGDSVPIESVWVDLQLEGSANSFSDYKEIFTHMKAKKCRLAIVRGQPGSGKTTLAKKIAYDWAKEKMKYFDLVLAVPLRDVQSKSDLLEMAVGIHIGNDDDIKRICADLRRERLKMLIVLDGLDEFQIPSNSHLSKIFGWGLSGVNVISASPIRFDFDLIVTSRPFACQLIHANIMTVKYEIVGFSEERKIEFVEKRCKTPKGKAKAMAYFIQSNCVKEISQNPLLLTMICFLCDRGELVPTTLTQLFATCVHRMLIRAAQKDAVGNDFDPSNWQHSELLKHLGSLALFGVIKCQYQFNPVEMQMCHVSKDYFRSGFLHYRSDPIGFGLKCDFPHRSIQDFLAALYTFYYWGDKTLLETTGWPTNIWPSDFVDLIPLVKVELLMARLLTTDSQFCRFIFGLSSGRANVPSLWLLQAVLDEIVDFHWRGLSDSIVYLGDDMADCSGEERLIAGQICNKQYDRIKNQRHLDPTSMQSRKRTFAEWSGVDRQPRRDITSIVLGKLSQHFTNDLRQFAWTSEQNRLELERRLKMHEDSVQCLPDGWEEEDDDVEKIMAKLKEKSELQPFAQMLPEIISLMQIYSSSTRVQLECIRLIQTFLPQKLSELTAELKANLVETMLTCLQTYSEVELIIENTTTLTKLEIFSDPIDKYTKTVEILLKIISNPEMMTKTKRSTIWLLNEIVKKSDENRQNLVGQTGGVEQICEVIRQQLNNPTYDRILVVSWVCLDLLCFNLPENQKKFLSAGGVVLFHLCYEKFGSEEEMVEMMMWMMSNLSCFSSARPQLVSKRNFDAFWQIVIKFNDNIAISWRCVNILVSFLCDSAIIWPLDSPTVEEAKNFMIETINSWKLDVQTSFSLSSLEEALDQLTNRKCLLSDLLIVWTLANLTTVDATRYCRMLRDERGVEILTTEVIRQPNSSLDAVILAKKAIDNVDKWAKSENQPGTL